MSLREVQSELNLKREESTVINKWKAITSFFLVLVSTSYISTIWIQERELYDEETLLWLLVFILYNVTLFAVEIGFYLTLEQLILHGGNLSSSNIQTNSLLKQALLNKYSLYLEDRH